VINFWAACHQSAFLSVAEFIWLKSNRVIRSITQSVRFATQPKTKAFLDSCQSGNGAHLFILILLSCHGDWLTGTITIAIHKHIQCILYIYHTPHHPKKQPTHPLGHPFIPHLLDPATGVFLYNLYFHCVNKILRLPQMAEYCGLFTFFVIEYRGMIIKLWLYFDSAANAVTD